MRPMRLIVLLLTLALVLAGAPAQATFSIVAVDPATGEVGSAGASCISGSIIISDVHPGVGVIHTQSYWNAANQNNARNRMRGIVQKIVERLFGFASAAARVSGGGEVVN